MPLRKIKCDSASQIASMTISGGNSSDGIPLKFTQSPLCKSCQEFLCGPSRSWTVDNIQQFQRLFEFEEQHLRTYQAEMSAEEITYAQNFCHVNVLSNVFREHHHRSCHLCVMVCTAFSQDDVFRAQFQVFEQKYLAGENIEYKVRCALLKNYDIDRFPFVLHVDITMSDLDLQAWTSFGIMSGSQNKLTDKYQSLNTSTSSGQSFDVIRSWLSACLAHHNDCRTSTLTGNESPARLLDLRHIASRGLITLVQMANAVRPCEYWTVSHRWGTSERLVLTKSNRHELEGSILIDRLPLTFRHAVDITIRLGYSWLWIDCLCIIQDSAEDWATEAAKMAAIYGGSVCCIAASASCDSYGGCYRERNPFAIQPLLIERGIFPEITDFKSSSQFVIGIGDIIRGSRMKSGPLDDRGWILQEQVLAPRTLHFTTNLIFWECRNTQASEIWPTGIPDDITFHLLDGKSKSLFDINQTLFKEQWKMYPENDQNLLYERWESLIELYTARHLTNVIDKFPALAGMIRVMMLRTQDDYLAGLWNKDLLHGLCWLVPPSKTLNARPSEYLGPTWSWVSVENAIRYDVGIKHARDIECRIHEVKVDYAENALTGRLRAASLTISGMMTSSSWIKDNSRRSGMRLNDKSRPWLRKENVQFYPDFAFKNISEQIHLLQLFRACSYFARNTSSESKTEYLGALVLQDKGTTYRRVGYMTIEHTEWKGNKGSWHNFTEDWKSEQITII